MQAIRNLANHLFPVLDILDEGLRIYRRGFVLFLLFSALALVPLAIGFGLSLVLEPSLMVLGFLGTTLLAIPLLLVLFNALTRATLAVQEARLLELREALLMSPLRMLGMGFYGLIVLIGAQILVSMISLFCFCPGFLILSFSFGFLGTTLFDQSALTQVVAVLLTIVSFVLIIAFYAGSIILSGATYSGLLYALQPFVQERLGFGAAVQQSTDLIGYRLGFNIVAFVLTSLVFAALSMAVTLSIGVIGPIPLVLVLGGESRVTQGLSLCIWIIGMILVVPPLPIWMTLLYQRNAVAREGQDLAQRIASIPS